jgi:hypothetical protein
MSESDFVDYDFVLRSETESICVYCFLTIRVKKASWLKGAENVHRQVCASKPRPASTQL